MNSMLTFVFCIIVVYTLKVVCFICGSVITLAEFQRGFTLRGGVDNFPSCSRYLLCCMYKAVETYGSSIVSCYTIQRSRALSLLTVAFADRDMKTQA